MFKQIFIVLLSLIGFLTITRGEDYSASLKNAPNKVASHEEVPTLLYNVHPSGSPGFLAPPKPNYDEINSRVTAAKDAPKVIPRSPTGYKETSGNPELDNTRLIPPKGFIAPDSQNKIPLGPLQPPGGSTGGEAYPHPVNSISQPHSGLNIPHNARMPNHPQSAAGPNQLPIGNVPPPPHSPRSPPSPTLSRSAHLPQAAGAGGVGDGNYPIDHATNYKPPVNPRPHGPINIGRSISISSNQPGGSNRQCTFSVSNNNEFHPSSDDFGYPKYQVEDAFERSIAKSVFEKYIDRPKDSSSSSGGLPPSVGLSGFSSVPGRLGGSRAPQNLHQNIPQNILTNAANRPAPRPQDYGFDPTTSRLFNNENGIQNKFNNIDNSAASPFGQSQFPGFHGNNGGFGGNVFSNSGISPFHFRRRRMAGFQSLDFQQDVKDICPPVSKSPLKSFRKYGSTCFVWQPTKQKLSFVTCSNGSCSTCRRKNTSSKCMAEQVERWVWAYCEQGPFAGQMALEQIKIPIHCTCKVYEC